VTYRVDLHVHSTLSADGASSIADHARRAVALGLAEVGFCEHLDLDPRDRTRAFLDLARYDCELEAARRALSVVQLRQGIEITFQSTRRDEIERWLAGRTWDYVVLSVHLVDYADGWTMISEPRAIGDYYAGHNQRQAYLPYFEELLRAAQSGQGDLLGHFDLIKRYGASHYGPFDPNRFADEIRSVLRAAVERGVGLEINSSGLRQPPGEPYPGLEVLRWYRALGGEILTIGSDAHHSSDLAAGLAEASDLARAAGFRAIATFEARHPRWLDL
jgi:histidinol-phosphatase (PHP family)